MVFGIAQTWVYSFEWQKRTAILWLSAKHRITPDKIDNVTSCHGVEIHDPSVNCELHQIVTYDR